MIPNDQISLRNEATRKAPRRGLDVMRSLRSHVGLIVFLFLVVASAGAYMAYLKDVPVYVSQGEIHVDRTYEKTVTTDRELELGSTRDYEIFKNEQVALLYKPEVVLEALRRAEQLNSGHWWVEGEPERFAVERVQASLVAYSIPNSYRIKAELYTADPDLAEPLLIHLFAAFQEAHKAIYSPAGDERKERLKKLLADSNALIAGKREELSELANELQVLDFETTPTNPWQVELLDLRPALAEAKRALEQQELELTNVQEALGSKEELLLLLAEAGEAADDSPLASALSQLLLERERLQDLLKSMGPQHAGRPQTETDLKSLEPRIDEALKRYSAAQIAAAQREIESANARVKALEKEVLGLEEQSAKFVAGFQRGAALERQIAEELPSNQRFRDRLTFFEVEAESKGFVSIAREPSEVDPNGESKLKRNVAIALVFALMIALGIPVLLDLFDNKVHTTQDVELALGIPPAVWIPRGTRGVRKTYAENQIRRLAMLMDHEERRVGPHVTLFTEVRHGNGTPDLIVESARTLAGLGRRVLVVDGRPQQQEQAPKGAVDGGGRGFQGLLAGDGLKPETRDGWDYLPFGSASNGALQSLSQWNRVVRDTCRDYDLVLIVAPPLLVSPEAEYMAASADLVLVVAEAEKQTLGELYRAGQILARIRPSAVGSVLNRVKVFRNRGYYKELVRDTPKIA